MTFIILFNVTVYLTEYAKPNQTTNFVHYNRVFVITVIDIAEFDCNS